MCTFATNVFVTIDFTLRTVSSSQSFEYNAGWLLIVIIPFGKWCAPSFVKKMNPHHIRTSCVKFGRNCPSGLWEEAF